MDDAQLRKDLKEHSALASSSRLRILDTLRQSGRSLDAQDLAIASGLHITTIRFHLDELRDAGLVVAHPEERSTRGRPRLLYSATEPIGVAGEDVGYAELAGVLASYWMNDSAEPGTHAEEAGLAWAGQQRSKTASVPVGSLREGVEVVTGVFTDLGFNPSLVGGNDSFDIHLHACPFRSVATRFPEVVCSVHLGLLRGLLDDLGVEGVTADLQPWVQPNLCVAHIGPNIQQPTHR